MAVISATVAAPMLIHMRTTAKGSACGEARVPDHFSISRLYDHIHASNRDDGLFCESWELCDRLRGILELFGLSRMQSFMPFATRTSHAKDDIPLRRARMGMLLSRRTRCCWIPRPGFWPCARADRFCAWAVGIFPVKAVVLHLAPGVGENPLNGSLS